MSKYEKLWMHFKTQASPKITLTYAEIEEIAGVPLDHSFLTYKKELLDFGWSVQKISMKNKTVAFAPKAFIMSKRSCRACSSKHQGKNLR